MASNYDGLDEELADIESEHGKRQPGSAVRILPMAVAAIALLSFGGIIWYAYNKGITTGSEVAAPLLKPEGPAKMTPADPGGLEVPHRDKLVYGTVDQSADDSKVERILPPPEDPMRPPVSAAAPSTGADTQISKRDVPIPSVTGADTAATADGSEPALPTPELAAPKGPPPSVGAEPDEERTETAVASTPSPAEPKAAPAKPVTATKAEKPAAEPQPAAKKVETTAEAPKTNGKLTTAGTAQAVALRTPEPAAQSAADTSSWRVQIASLRSEEDAKREWDRRRKALPDVLGKLTLNVQVVEIKDKGRYYRVQAGPLKSREDANGLCRALKQKKVDCLIVRPK